MEKETAKKLMEKAKGASTGLAVTVAFLNTALLIVKIVKEVKKD